MHVPDSQQLKQRGTADIEGRRQELIDLSLRIHACPETAFQEEQSAALLCDFLEANGFAVERGICEIPTAFRGSCGSGEPRPPPLAEYRAPPGAGAGRGA